MKKIKIGYAALNSDMKSAPGDYRRFVYYANARNIEFSNAEVDKKYDLVVLSQGADISVWKEYSHGKIVYDFIDSYLSIPRSNIKALLRGFAKFCLGKHKKLYFNYWKLVQNMCKGSDMVICSTIEQKYDILPFCKNVPIILDFHENTVINYKRTYNIDEKVKIVWEGLPSNLYQLNLIGGVLNKLSDKYNIELHVVTDLNRITLFNDYVISSTDKQVKKIFNNSIVHKWSKENLSKVVCNCDIAIIPIDMNSSLNKNKPENKLLLFWRMKIPVVVSATHSYSRTMKDAGLELSCATDSQWLAKLEQLIKNENLRKKSASIGYKYANKKYSECNILRKWDDAFESIGFKFK